MTAREPARDHGRVCPADRSSRDAAALGARLPAVAPHPGEPRGDALDRQDLPREEAPLRRADLPGDRLLPVGLEHRSRIVHLQPVGVPRPQGDARRAARDAFPRRAARRHPLEVGERERERSARAGTRVEEKAASYWNAHRKVFALGVDGWWPDEGDPLDAASRLARIRMYWEGPQLDRPDRRPYALHRNGYAGMQRYGAFLWSGDVDSTWETLKTHVPIAINTSLTGIPYWGTDIGGFVPTKELTGELYVRWFQFGAFCPLFRSHGRTWKLRLPWGWNTGELGPNEIRGYGDAANPGPDELHNAAVEPICRKYLELRYRLMPYLYSVVRECCLTGLPIIRALWLHDPDDPVGRARGDEFLWGPNILVAPVTEKGATTRRLYLPRGRWYDFWTGESLEGGREISRAVDLATHAPVRPGRDDPADGPGQAVHRRRRSTAR